MANNDLTNDNGPNEICEELGSCRNTDYIYFTGKLIKIRNSNGVVEDRKKTTDIATEIKPKTIDKACNTDVVLIKK